MESEEITISRRKAVTSLSAGIAATNYIACFNLLPIWNNLFVHRNRIGS